eukprot:4572092-Pyramimonas_sp.AAC.1
MGVRQQGGQAWARPPLRASRALPATAAAAAASRRPGAEAPGKAPALDRGRRARSSSRSTAHI